MKEELKQSKNKFYEKKYNQIDSNLNNKRRQIFHLSINEKNVLNNVTLDINKGDKIGIIGSSDLERVQ